LEQFRSHTTDVHDKNAVFASLNLDLFDKLVRFAMKYTMGTSIIVGLLVQNCTDSILFSLSVLN